MRKIVLILVGLFVVGIASAATPSYLFTQAGQRITIQPGPQAGQTLIQIHQVSDKTTYFSDRPIRKAGSMSIQAFLHDWDKGKTSFHRDNPNASLVYFDDHHRLMQTIVELSKPTYDQKKQTLSYLVKYIGQGQLQAGRFQHPVLFIDGWHWGSP